MSNKLNENLYQWYIATTYSGREDSVVRDLQAKIKSLDLDQYVKTIRTFKSKQITEKIFDASNPPPAHMRNTKNVHWEAGNKPGTYKKIETKIVNKFSGYIFIEMILNDKVWLAIRNSFYITGFVGSSGKGAKPIPISSEELQTMLNDDVQSENTKVETSNVEEFAEEELPSLDVKVNYGIGDRVKVVLGDWKDQIGTVRSINLETGEVIVDIEFLNSLNTITVQYDDVEKVEQSA